MRKGIITTRAREALLSGWRSRCGYGPAAGGHRQAEIRRHARGRHGLRDAVGAILGLAGLELEAQPRHRPVLRAAVRRRPLQERRNGGPHPFYADAWLPSDAIRGELAESWEWKDNPLRIEIKLRKGIMFPEKPGVMASRELVADDVVFSYNRLAKSPKKIADYFNHVDKVEATDTHTVVFTFKATSPNGTIASARATTRHLSPKRWPMPAPPTGRTSTAPGPSCSPTSCRATPTPTPRTRSTGTRTRSTAASTSCPSSTSSSIAPSRTRRPSSPRCAPASSTCSRTFAGRTSRS